MPGRKTVHVFFSGRTFVDALPALAITGAIALPSHMAGGSLFGHSYRDYVSGVAASKPPDQADAAADLYNHDQISDCDKRKKEMERVKGIEPSS